MRKKILLVYIFWIFFLPQQNWAIENKILLKIDKEIITTIDIINEFNYLSILNKNFKKLPETKALEVSKNSIIRDKIKKIELKKSVKFNEINEDMLNKLIQRFYVSLKLNNLEDFKKYLENNNLKYGYIKEKIMIESLWNELIYKKYSSQIKIDISKIEKDLSEKNTSKSNEYLLSEIVFNPKNKKDFEIIINKINEEINNNGFENAAFEHSISETAKTGGKLEWISENKLNELILKNINDLKIGDHTTPIRIPSGFLILKIEDKKEIEKKINIQDEIKKMVRFKTNNQLNQFSKIYFNKVKKEIDISEL
jgi:peptidyl-prolyl cis-trans isomerase SurA